MTASPLPSPLAALLAIAMPMLAGCVTTTATGGTTDVHRIVATDVGCTAFEPIRWSPRDTDATIRAAKEHNAVLDALCNRKSPTS